MYGTEKVSEDAERTAFRRAEKKYKLYYEDTFKSSKKYFFLETSLFFTIPFEILLNSLTICFHFTEKNNRSQLIYRRFWISRLFWAYTNRTSNFLWEFPLFNVVSTVQFFAWKIAPVTMPISVNKKFID